MTGWKEERVNDVVRVLTVCTGNICRSPAVERLLQARLGDGVSVSGAGTGAWAVAGQPMSPEMAALVRGAGVDPDGCSARVLTAAMIRESDLVLPLTAEHRRQVLHEVPAALRRTFTLLELAAIAGEIRFLEGDTVAARLRNLIELAPARRAAVSSHVVDVPDPYGLGPEVYAESFAMISHAVDTLATVVGGTG